MPKKVFLNSVTDISQSSSKKRWRPPPSAEGPGDLAQLQVALGVDVAHVRLSTVAVDLVVEGDHAGALLP